MSKSKVDGNMVQASYPIQYFQVSNLLGQILTLVDMLGLSEGQEKSCKDMVTQTTHRWFDRVVENSETASVEELKPMFIPDTGKQYEEYKKKGLLRTGAPWKSESLPEE